ncbi:MAG: hypothetical protein QXR17_06835 [Candidatus Bathyarchaeia archaeon]
MEKRGLSCSDFRVRYLVGEIGWHRLYDRTFENFDFSDNRLLQKFLYQKVSEDRWVKGVALIGDVGVGKTHLLIALYKNRVWEYVYGVERRPVWISWYEFVIDVRKYGRELLNEVVFDNGIFFVDDFFVRVSEREFEREIIAEFVYRIYDLRKVLCFSSNFEISRVDVDERVKDRLREMVDEVIVRGRSRRDQIE